MTRSFDDAWSKWINTECKTFYEKHQLLEQCVDAATTIDQLVQVFWTADQEIAGGVQSKAGWKILGLIQTNEEAERLHKLLNNRGLFGRRFEVLGPAVRKKLESFNT